MSSILVVDDDVDFASVVADVLRAAGHSVRFALDGPSGAAQIVSERPDVVLCDVQMPFGGGSGLVTWLRARGDGSDRIPLILVSAGDDLQRVAASLDTPYFLAKPFSIASLVVLVVRVLDETASLRREGKGSPRLFRVAPTS